MKFRGIFRNKVVLLSAVIVLAVGGACVWWLSHRQPSVPNILPATTNTVKPKETKRDDLLASGWDYLPGATMQKDGLHIDERAFTIVNQDGSGGQSNPPINLYGTHLTVSGDWAITAHIADPGTTKASLRLYGGVPTIMDEFRIEPKSIRFTLDGLDLKMELWNGSSNQPVDRQTYQVKQVAANNTLQIERVGGILAIHFNDVVIGTMQERGVFGTTVWFGMESQGGNWLLSSLDAKALRGGTVSAVNTATSPTIAPAGDGLQTLASKKRAGFLVGAAAALAPATADDAYRQVLFGNFGLITTENALKWQFIHPAAGVYDFHEADALVDAATRNGQKIHGHTLVFGEANTRWIQDLPASQREAAMLDHITTVVSHYKGKMVSWDVVNEPFDDDEWDQLRPNIWQKAMGESYIAKAFNAAHAADPGAQLFINDYGLEEDGDRWDAMLGLVTRLKQQGVPIDGVGFQAHVYESGDKINASVLRKHIQQLAAHGLKARISEMDVYREDGQSVQASQYSQVLQACLSETNCVAFTTWGVSDRYDWFKDDDGSIQQGEDYLWNTNMQPTPAVSALLQVLR